jgi:hypothetical protein
VLVAVGGMMATAATGWGTLGETLAIPIASAAASSSGSSTASAWPSFACRRWW